MPIPTSFFTETYNDNTIKSNGEPESATISLPIQQLSAASVVAKLALVAALRTAMDALVIGVDAKQEVVWSRSVFATTAASSSLAQRENKFLFRYHGATTNKKFRASLPTADLTKVVDHTEFVDLTAGEGLALKDAFEDIVVSPDNDTESVVLDSVQFVGRNT